MASKWIAHKCMSPSLLHQMSQPPAAERSFEGIRPGPCSSKILYAAVDSGTDISMEISSPTPHGTCCWISIWLQNGIRVRFRSQACASPQPSPRPQLCDGSKLSKTCSCYPDALIHRPVAEYEFSS